MLLEHFISHTFFTMTIYGSDDKFLGNGTISVFVSYSGMDSKNTTIDLSHDISSGETFYLKISCCFLCRCDCCVLYDEKRKARSTSSIRNTKSITKLEIRILLRLIDYVARA